MGQSFGANRSHMLGIYRQRSCIVVLSCIILLLPHFIFATPILRLLGQEEPIASMAGTFSLWFIPIIFALAFSYTFQMYLQAQSRNIVVTYLVSLALVLHISFSWLLVTKLSLGVAGAMGSMVIAMWVPNFAQFAFLICGGCPDTWKGSSASAFQDLWPVIKLSLSSGAMVCLELWYNSVLILLTGHMNNAEITVDALSIWHTDMLININGWEMMVSLGFLAAAGIRLAKGAGNAKAVRFSIMVVVTESLSIGIFSSQTLKEGKVAMAHVRVSSQVSSQVSTSKGR